MPPALSRQFIVDVVRSALQEDIGSGDATSLATVPASLQVTAYMVARENLVTAGLALAVEAFKQISATTDVEPNVLDGQRISAGRRILVVKGSARAILSGERVALNFVQRLSGIATLTVQFADAIKGTRAKILDTRKTTPGWRSLEKYAVICGGGSNHRFGLFDMVLIKDNHLAALRQEKPNPIAVAVSRARAQYPRLKIEVEADTLEQVGQAVETGADRILLDNMNTEQLSAAVKLVAGRAKTEASGGVNLKTVRAIADTGVDYISVGAITHSARAVDIGLDFVQ